jgi:hypothetical protein
MEGATWGSVARSRFNLEGMPMFRSLLRMLFTMFKAKPRYEDVLGAEKAYRDRRFIDSL